MTPGAGRRSARSLASRAREPGVFLIFVAGYYLLGLAGLQLQSAQTGITPVWPASGFALAMVYWFGLHHVAALLPAMLALGWTLGLDWQVAAVSALGSMLEAAVPVYLMRRLDVAPGLRHLRDVLLFVALAPILGPVFSASVGSLVFHLLGGSTFDLPRLWLLWWLGNSVGLLLVGGFGLVVVARRSLRLHNRAVLELVTACLLVVLITAVGLQQVVDISSPLVLYLLIPIFVLIAQRGDQLPVLLLGVIALLVILLSATWLPPESLAQTSLGIFYLDVSLLWVVVFTGVVISAARHEMLAREQVSWLANHDPLTHLLNRHAFMQCLDNLPPSRSGPRSGHVLMYLDLDHFKRLNDVEGHLGGDQVLRDLGRMLNREVRAADVVARLGGDTFAVILEDCQLTDACAIAENVRSAVEGYEYQGARGVHRVEVSIGLLHLRGAHMSAQDALHRADGACYEAKRAGRNRVWLATQGQEDGPD